MKPTVTHHISEPILMAYATGSLSEAFSLVVASHLSLCDECRAAVAAFEAVGGTLIEGCESARMDEDALDAIWSRIDARGDVAEPATAAPAPGVLPAPLRDYVGGDLDSVKWRSVGGGIRQAVLETGRRDSVRLLSIPGGVAVPDHGHRGTELTLVLQGAFSDADGTFRRGDVEVADEDVDHQPVACPGEDCICLAATENALRFRGLIPRLAQRFMGI